MNTLATYTVLVIVATQEATFSWNWGAGAELLTPTKPRRQRMAQVTKQVQISNCELSDAQQRHRLVLVYRLLSDLGRRHRLQAPREIGGPATSGSHIEGSDLLPCKASDMKE